MNHLFEIFLLFAAPVLGALVALWMKQGNEDQYKLVLTFSGSFLFSVMLMHLLPEIFQKEGVKAGVFMLIGFFIQVFLEQTTHGIEHGHFHTHKESSGFLLSLFIGLSVHSFFDGIPVVAPHSGEHEHTSLLYGISLHKIPEGFALASMFLFSGFKKNSVLMIVLLFALIAPAGTLLSSWIQQHDLNYYPLLLAVVAGSLLHVSTTILFESESGRHAFTWKKILAIIFGAALSFLTL